MHTYEHVHKVCVRFYNILRLGEKLFIIKCLAIVGIKLINAFLIYLFMHSFIHSSIHSLIY